MNHHRPVERLPRQRANSADLAAGLPARVQTSPPRPMVRPARSEPTTFTASRYISINPRSIRSAILEPCPRPPRRAPRARPPRYDSPHNATRRPPPRTPREVRGGARRRWRGTGRFRLRAPSPRGSGPAERHHRLLHPPRHEHVAPVHEVVAHRVHAHDAVLVVVGREASCDGVRAAPRHEGVEVDTAPTRSASDRDGPTAERAEVRGVMRGVHRHVPPVPRPRVVHREHKVHHRSVRRVVARGRSGLRRRGRLRQDTGAVPERVIDRGTSSRTARSSVSIEGSIMPKDCAYPNACSMDNVGETSSTALSGCWHSRQRTMATAARRRRVVFA